MSMFLPDLKGVLFTGSHEGFVGRAYKDQGGVLTIGFGFTNLSPICKQWFMQHWGHLLRADDKMTRAEADELLGLVMRTESAPLANALLPVDQNAFNAENDVIYNCGPKAVGWQWALAAKVQNYARAASLLLTTATTASGVPSQGLRNRRADEAALLSARVGSGTAEPTVSEDAAITKDRPGILAIQNGLETLKYYTGSHDGVFDSPEFIKASKNFQRAYGLTVDGRWGKASRGTLNRALQAQVALPVTASSGMGGGGIGLGMDALGIHLVDNPWVIVGIVVGALVVAYCGFLVWHNRGVLLRQRTPA